jgi:hypothetical protein
MSSFRTPVVVNADGSYNCHRKAILPLQSHVWHRLPVITCSLFLRRSVLDKRGVYLDTRWRDVADFFWVMEMFRHKVPMAVLRQFTSVFTETGENMNLKPNARRESQIKMEMTPRWVRTLAPAIVFHHHLRCLAGGFFPRSRSPTRSTHWQIRTIEPLSTSRNQRPSGSAPARHRPRQHPDPRPATNATDVPQSKRFCRRRGGPPRPTNDFGRRDTPKRCPGIPPYNGNGRSAPHSPDSESG